MFTLETLSKVGIVLSFVFIANMLSDLNDNSNQLLESAIQIQSSQKALVKHTNDLIYALEVDPVIALNSNIQDKFTKEKLNNDTQSFYEESKNEILKNASQIESEILSEDTNYTVEEVENEIKVNFDKANEQL